MNGQPSPFPPSLAARATARSGVPPKRVSAEADEARRLRRLAPQDGGQGQSLAASVRAGGLDCPVGGHDPKLGRLRDRRPVHQPDRDLSARGIAPQQVALEVAAPERRNRIMLLLLTIFLYMD